MGRRKGNNTLQEIYPEDVLMTEIKAIFSFLRTGLVDFVTEARRQDGKPYPLKTRNSATHQNHETE